MSERVDEWIRGIGFTELHTVNITGSYLFTYSIRETLRNFKSYECIFIESLLWVWYFPKD